MIKRIVKLTFRPDQVETFLHNFENNKHNIRTFPGCLHLELLRSTDEPNVFFTYSFWDAPTSLDAYRQSELFAKVWKQTKVLFAQRAEAWSVELFDLVRPPRL
ncbi:MAG: antibiotic biosynthesis monooxygenase family protein [Bacteroidota bacterium]